MNNEPVAPTDAVLDELLRSIAGEMPDRAVLRPLPSGMGVGVRVKATSTHHIDVVAQLVNWRVCSTRIGENEGYGSYDGAYCYFGRGAETYLRAVLGALVWGGPGPGHPPGWQKNALTGDYAQPDNPGRAS